MLLFPPILPPNYRPFFFRFVPRTEKVDYAAIETDYAIILCHLSYETIQTLILALRQAGICSKYARMLLRAKNTGCAKSYAGDG